MFTLELSSCLYEIPNDAYTTNTNSDRLFNTQSWVLQADWLIFEINEKETLNINMPYYFVIPGNKRAIYSSLIFCAHIFLSQRLKFFTTDQVLNGVCKSRTQGSQLFLIDMLATLPQCNLDWNRRNYSVKTLHSDSSTDLSGNSKMMQFGILGIKLAEQRHSSSLWLSLCRSLTGAGTKYMRQ